ncbi:hypothetical protein [Micromonospora arida]
MGSLDDLIRDLKTFERRKDITSLFAKEVRKSVPSVRAAIKRRALDTLPKGGGLNVWVSKARVTARVKLTGRSAGVTLKGSRKSAKDKSDLKRLDAGVVRHPSWGRRGADQWHTQTVEPGYFTKPATEVDQWRKAVDTAVDKALEVIRRG